MAIWKFNFETEFGDKKRPHPISVEADNWADASGKAAEKFMNQNPNLAAIDFTSVTASLISVED
ncbi:MAG: hypothetical protein VKP70_09030 [Cyanobacteriota bacterium]|nr:hypothetical protein [Cyanobacteriota bacterium]